MAEAVSLKYLSKRLKEYQWITISYLHKPKDEILYKFINHRAYTTTTGYLLLLELETGSNVPVIFSIPDVMAITRDSLSSAKEEKFYLECSVRHLASEYKEQMELVKRGFRDEDTELNFIKRNKSIVIQILIKN